MASTMYLVELLLVVDEIQRVKHLGVSDDAGFSYGDYLLCIPTSPASRVDTPLVIARPVL